MEAIKKFIRFSQIQRSRSKHIDLQEFQKFYDQGEKAWLNSNLSPAEYVRFHAEDRYQSKMRFYFIHDQITQKIPCFDVFEKFFQDEESWIKKT